MRNYNSWGNLKYQMPKKVIISNSALEANRLSSLESAILVYGNGRSYGDVNQNSGNILIDNTKLNLFISFDRQNGILTAQSGVTLKDILALIVPQGWFLPVTPGTQFVTLGGAVANDVHGKNHHKVGSLGCFVNEFELVRSHGERVICSPNQNSPYFYATIGGLGLTGWITWIKLKLIPIQNDNMIVTSTKFANLNEYFLLNQVFEQKYTYTVAWIDCLSKGKNLGRGVYFTGEHAGYQHDLSQIKKSRLNVPFTMPISLINRYSLKAFNFLYYNKSYVETPHLQHYQPFFYPLDSIANWNRVYGKSGFYQYQLVVPMENAKDSIKAILNEISKSNTGSFLAVLKSFGEINSGGLLSFPRPGVTLALDFPNLGKKTKELFNRLDKIVYQAHGALYPAKDACMSEEMFLMSYPNLSEFIKYKDPKFSSNFWRRVVGN